MLDHQPEAAGHKLTKADLDRSIANRFADTLPAATPTPASALLKLPASCTGDCDHGGRDCTCAGAVIGMWDDERQAPGLLLLYVMALLLAMVASVLYPWGFA